MSKKKSKRKGEWKTERQERRSTYGKTLGSASSVRPSVCPSRIKRRHPPEFFSFWACHNIRTCWIVLWWHLLWIFVGSLSIYFLITGPSWSYGFLRFFFFFRIRVLLTSFLILFSWYTCVSISSRAISFTRVRYIAPSLHRQGSLFHITPLVSPLSLSLSLLMRLHGPGFSSLVIHRVAQSLMIPVNEPFSSRSSYYWYVSLFFSSPSTI